MTETAPRDAVRTPAARPLPPAPPEADPIQTEVIRQSLNAAALQMRQALGLQHFMGRLSFCVALAVEAAGGKDPYSTDTVDVFQEGTIFPGVKLCRAGVIVDDIMRMVSANSRVPQLVAGDLQAEIVGVRTGAAALTELIEKYGEDVFWPSVARMFAHGESVVRSYFSEIPDGVYTASGELDDNGVETDGIPFEISLTVDGSHVTVDFSRSPGMQAGPVNCPLPGTIAAARVAVMMLAGGGEAPNEGHFAAVDVITRPGTMFHPESPAPCFLYGWPAIQAIEVIFRAIADARPKGVPAGSGGCVCSLVWWGEREETGEPWADGAPYPIGLGAHPDGDGGSALMHIAQTAARTSPAEVFEARYPLRIVQSDFGGPGRHRGGLGLDMDFLALEDCLLTSVFERTKNAPWGLKGGFEARPNASTLRLPDGTLQTLGKKTRVKVPRGATLEIRTGGGGGHGSPSERGPQAVLADVRDGYISDAAARRDYPHAFEAGA